MKTECVKSKFCITIKFGFHFCFCEFVWVSSLDRNKMISFVTNLILTCHKSRFESWSRWIHDDHWQKQIDFTTQNYSKRWERDLENDLSKQNIQGPKWNLDRRKRNVHPSKRDIYPSKRNVHPSKRDSHPSKRDSHPSKWNLDFALWTLDFIFTFSGLGLPSCRLMLSSYRLISRWGGV